jgi:hypothetical protein
MTEFIDALITVFCLIFFSICGRILLEKIGQNWIVTFSHTVTIVLLPVITFIITKVIAGNIALSLGMVGALSIVRFRNPVRSPFELSIYFACITMGIAASVHIRWLFYFMIAITLVVITLILFNLIFKFFKKEFFKISFTEGNSLATLEIESDEEFEILDNSIYLQSKVKNENKFVYVLASSKIESLNVIIKNLNKTNHIKNYQLKSS